MVSCLRLKKGTKIVCEGCDLELEVTKECGHCNEEKEGECCCEDVKLTCCGDMKIKEYTRIPSQVG